MRKRALKRKRRWQAALVLTVLIVLGLMIWLAVIGSSWLVILFAALFIGLALLLFYYLGRAVMSGELPARFGKTFRQSSPVLFWVGIGIHGLSGGFIFFIGLTMLGLAPHWFLSLLRSMHSHH